VKYFTASDAKLVLINKKHPPDAVRVK
jgi:hypothetical protein